MSSTIYGVTIVDTQARTTESSLLFSTRESADKFAETLQKGLNAGKPAEQQMYCFSHTLEVLD